MIRVIDHDFATCFFCIVNFYNPALIKVNRKNKRGKRNITER